MRKFFSLDARRRGLFLKAYYLLGAMRVGMVFSSFKRMAHGLERNAVAGQPGVPHPVHDRRIEEIGWAVRAAARNTPWDSACLVQALAAQRLLESEGIGGELFVGAEIRNQAGQDAALDAHAWVKSGEAFVTGQAGHERFAVVTTFSW